MTFDDYPSFRSDPANDHISDGMWCGTNMLNIQLLSNWKLANPAVMFSILEKRRGLYADALIKVDQALFEKAKAGDPRAIELCWSRFENWSPKIEEANAKAGLGKNKTLADLMGEL